MFIAVISFGSNYEAKSNLIRALKALNQQVQICAISPVYENPAITKKSSPPYLNGVCLVETTLPPIALQEEVLRPIEDALDRARGEEGKIKCTIDLDILLYDQEILSTPTLELPSPDILNYAYCAIPLGFLIPNGIHPLTQETMAQIASRFSQEKTAFYHRVEVNSAIEQALKPTQSIMKQIQPWHWRKLPLNQRSGSEIFATLFLSKNAENMAVLLESPVTSSTDLTRYSICAGSPRVIDGKSQLWTPPVGEILPFLREILHSQKPIAQLNLPPEIPFTGGWLGWLGYDLAWEIEKLPQLNTDPLPFPVSCWYEPESFAVLDHQEQILWLAASQPYQLDVMQHQLEPINRDIRHKDLPENPQKNPVTPLFQLSQNDYEEIVGKAQKYIDEGDIFQANLSLRFEAHTDCDSWSIYRALQEINPSPFASYWQTPWGAIVSCSPERLVQLSGKQVETRPIAGTRSRGLTTLQDEELAMELIDNIKERAEHIMLVDLERNDIGRVCEWGSVKVNEFLTIERYSHVMHLVSNVIGTLRQDCDAIDLIRAVFPGGTITGCPKVRCLEIIEELEPVKRNLFYGSCGYLDWRGNLDLNILIRTLLYAPKNDGKPGGIVWGQVGAGIVADSDPEREWKESLHKAQAQLNALKLAERLG